MTKAFCERGHECYMRMLCDWAFPVDSAALPCDNAVSRKETDATKENV